MIAYRRQSQTTAVGNGFVPMMRGMIKPFFAHRLGQWATLIIFSAAGCHPTAPVAPSNTLSGDVAKNAAMSRAQTGRGVDLIVAGKYTDAEPVLRRAIDADPLYGPAHNDLGLVYYRLNRLYDAAWEFEKAIKLMPRQPEPRNNLGLVLEEAGKLPEALQDFTLASEIDPANPEYLANLARVRLRMGLTDEQTRRVLESLILKETRPSVREWARFTLIRLQGTKINENPATVPATEPANE